MLNCRAIAVAATASGGETIAPMTTAVIQSIPRITAWANQATVPVVASNQSHGQQADRPQVRAGVTPGRKIGRSP